MGRPLGIRPRPPALFEVVVHCPAQSQLEVAPSSTPHSITARGRPVLAAGSPTSPMGHRLSSTRSSSTSALSRSGAQRSRPGSSPALGSLVTIGSSGRAGESKPRFDGSISSVGGSTRRIHCQPSSIFFEFPGTPPPIAPEHEIRVKYWMKPAPADRREGKFSVAQTEEKSSTQQIDSPPGPLRQGGNAVDVATPCAVQTAASPAPVVSEPASEKAQRTANRVPKQPSALAATPQAGPAEAPHESNPPEISQLERSRREHQAWAAEAFATIFASAVIGGVQASDLKGLGVGALQGGLCRGKLGECLAGSVQDASKIDSVVDPLVKFICKKTTDGDGQLPYREFEDFTWNLRQMEHQLKVEADGADFVFKMFSGNKIGNLSKNDFVQLFKEAEDAIEHNVSDGHERRENRANIASIIVQTESTAEVAHDGGGQLCRGESGAPGLAEGPVSTPSGGWGNWAVPSEASASPRSDGSGSSRSRSPRDSAQPSTQGARRHCLSQPPPVSLAHLGLLAEAPAAWRELVRKKGLMHREWANSRFVKLDDDADGYLGRGELTGETFARMLLECLGDRLPDAGDIEVLIDAAMRGADVQADKCEGRGCLGREDFEAFTWRLKRMVADTDFEVGQALGSAAGSAWRDLVARVRVPHRDWALLAFNVLDINSIGHLTREDLRRPGFEYLLGQCPGGRLADVARARPCFGLAFRRADAKGAGKLSPHNFDDFTWQLSRMGVDVEQEAHRFAELVKAEVKGEDPK